MRNILLGGVAIASAFAFMVPSAPASAQNGCVSGHACAAPRAAAAGQAQARYQPQSRYQHQGYARNYGRGDGAAIGVGAAALATGVIIGGAMQQNPGYYSDGSYPVYSDQYPAPVYSDQDAGPVYSDQGPGPVYSNQDPTYGDAGPQVAASGDTTAYCERTYRSYDPASGAYLGYDGLRHPCP
jgi:hypothetical protein